MWAFETPPFFFHQQLLFFLTTLFSKPPTMTTFEPVSLIFKPKDDPSFDETCLVKVGGGFLKANTVIAKGADGSPLVWTTDTDLLFASSAGPDIWEWFGYELMKGRPDESIWPAVKSSFMASLAILGHKMPGFDDAQAKATIKQAATTLVQDVQTTWELVQAKATQLGDDPNHVPNKDNSLEVRFHPENHPRLAKIAVPTDNGVLLKKGYWDDVNTAALGLFGTLTHDQRMHARFRNYLGYVNCKSHCYDGGKKPNESIDERHTVPPFEEIKEVAAYLLSTCN